MQATVDEKLAELHAWWFDGINIDIESSMQNESQAASLLETVQFINRGLKAKMPWLSTSFAVAHLGSEVDRAAARLRYRTHRRKRVLRACACARARAKCGAVSRHPSSQPRTAHVYTPYILMIQFSITIYANTQQ